MKDLSSGARGDGFGEERKRMFLVALRGGEGVLAACRAVGISNRTAYNHRRDDPEFARQWALVRGMATLPLDLALYERAVEGVEEPVYFYGKLSHVRRRRSDALLGRMLAAEKPEKYGRSAPALAQGKLAKRLKRLARRLEALEARLESDVRTARRASEAVNFMNPAAPSAAAPKSSGGLGKSGTNWRLSAARRRVRPVKLRVFADSREPHSVRERSRDPHPRPPARRAAIPARRAIRE